VIDNSPERKKVEHRPFQEFTQGRPYRFVSHPGAFPPHVVLARALSRLGDPYDPISSNCQHFVTWCATGKARSPQIEGVLALAALSVVAVAGMSMAA
jgi:hypothetical protein